jgi:hypothetical protein
MIFERSTSSAVLSNAVRMDFQKTINIHLVSSRWLVTILCCESDRKSSPGDTRLQQFLLLVRIIMITYLLSPPTITYDESSSQAPGDLAQKVPHIPN